MNHPATETPRTAHIEERGEMEASWPALWLALFRLACLIFGVLSIVVFAFSVPVHFAQLHVLCVSASDPCHNLGQNTPVVVNPAQQSGLSIDFVAFYLCVLASVLSLCCWIVAGVLFWRRPNNPLALLAIIYLGTFPIVFNTGFTSALPSAWWPLTHTISLVGTLCAGLFNYLFPSGRFVPGWTRWLFAFSSLYWTLNILFPFSAFNPFYTHQMLNTAIFIGLILSLIFAQVYRYRRTSSPPQRAQSKWVVYGLAMGWGGYLALLVLAQFFPSLYQTGSIANLVALTALYGFISLIPVSLGVAILRSRLWDIDIVINRTLVYGVLTVCVVGVYVLVVGSLGALFGASGNLVISLGATAVVAVLFQPLREWFQREVNRLLYGQRDEPYTVITQLSQRLEATLASDAVMATVVETVAQALKLPYVAILLKQDEQLTLAASAGEPVEEPVRLPLVYQAETIGQLNLAPRASGDAFTPADRRLLDELARQAGQAAHAAQLTADLQRSHERLEQRVVERTRELASLLEISRTVASTLQLKPLLGLILDELKTVVPYTDASILTLESDDLIFLDHRGLALQAHILEPRIPLKRLGPIWQTIAAGAPALIENIYAETQVAQGLRAAIGDHSEPAVPYPCSWMVVPLRLRDQVNGMLVTTANEENTFTPRHATLALAIANQAAVAIENARLYEQAQELAALEERQKLARDLHDSVSQALYGIALGLHTARIQLGRDPDELPESLDYLLTLAEAALAEMRALIFELRPESLEHEGLVAALSKQGAALQARHNVIVQMDLCDEPPLPIVTKQELYRIAQEALQNVIKHAHAGSVDLALRRTADVVMLEIGDDGVGFDPLGSYPGHLGLRSMRERVERLGGVLQIESASGQGTRLVVKVPLEKRSRDTAGVFQAHEETIQHPS
jgi:signal transduction histidine kinase